jgi:hypothetical protein
LEWTLSKQLTIVKIHRWTKELCAKRFMVYKMKDNVETAFSFMSKIYGLLEFEKMVREDEDIPADKKEAKIQKKIKEVAEAFGVSVSNINFLLKKRKITDFPH